MILLPMPALPLNKQPTSSHSRSRLMLTCGLPVLLVLGFVARQWFKLDTLGWSEGFNHPLSGWDHLLTMVAVGIWAAQLRGQAIWMLPLSFVGVMSLGAVAGAANLAIPSVEGIILLSCAVFSVLITRRMRFHLAVNLSIVAFFAFFHGFAHGHEISTSTSLISYTLGFMLATLLLHGSGIVITKLLVLIVSFLLSSMFSASVLAKAQDSITGPGHAPAALSPAMQNSAWFGERHGYTGLASAHVCASDQARHSSGDDIQRRLASKSVTGNVGADASLRTTKSQVKSLSPHSPGVQALPSALFEPWPVAARLESFAAVAGHCPLGLPFKAYFPEINHTPGSPRAMGGVGLTSPPVASCFLADILAVPNSRQTSIDCIETATFQLRKLPFFTDIKQRLLPQNRIQADAANVSTGLADSRSIHFFCYAVVHRYLAKRSFQSSA